MPMAESIRHVRTVPALPHREPDAHKGTFGRVLVIGGSVGMAGAPALVSLAALRGGAGLVTFAVPESIQPTVAGLCPCATSIPLPETSKGQIDPAKTPRLLHTRGLLGKSGDGTPPDVLAIGPGLGQGTPAYATAVWELIDAFRMKQEVPAVVDADALNLAAAIKPGSPRHWDHRPNPRTIITPHPGELARLLGVSTREIQAKREHHAVETARRLNRHTGKADPGTVVVLKGAGTIVTDGHRVYINHTGNPGMATGGSGDVLTGLIAALVGQKMALFDAAVAGVHLHGLAGDLAAERMGEVSLIATDTIDYLPAAIAKRAEGRRKDHPH